MWDTFFEQASRLRAAGEPFALATVVACQRPTAAYPGAKALIKTDGTLTGWVGGSCAQPTVLQEALKALADGKSRLLRISPEFQHSAVPQEGVYDFVMTCASQGALEIFVEPFLPRPELIVIGGPLARAWPLVSDTFASIVERSVRRGLPSARIIPSTLGERTTVMGALSLVLSAKFASVSTI